MGATLAGKSMARIGPRLLIVGGMALGAIGLVLFTQIGVGLLEPRRAGEIITSLGTGWPSCR